MEIRTRQMASAFLFYDNKVLLMRKRASKWQQQTEPFYAAIGGHLEPLELNDPVTACFREIEEETGYRREDILDLRLKYILLRRKENEIRQQFVYVGQVRHADVVESEEGELGWHRLEETHQLRSSAIMHAMLAHYRAHADCEAVCTGTMAVTADGQPHVHWHTLIDPKVF